MPSLKTLYFWPATGLILDRQEAAFVRTAQRVAHTYSSIISTHALPADHSEIRFFTQHARRAREVVVQVNQPIPSLGGFNSASITIPSGVRALAPAVRGQLVVDVTHLALTGFATHFGWSPVLLDAAHEEANAAAGLDFVWRSAWKSSPGRRWKARMVYRIDDSARDWAHIESISYELGRPLKSEEVEANLVDLPLFKRWYSLRWLDKSSVGLQERDPITDSPRTRILLDANRSANQGPLLETMLPTAPAPENAHEFDLRLCLQASAS